MNIEKIDINLIIADKSQPRKIFDEKQIDELAISIQNFGLLQPILVQKTDAYYKIIAGERRYRACKKLGFKNIDVIVKNDDNTAEIALIENIQREDLSSIEEAKAILLLKEQKGYTHEEVSKILGKTRTYITNKLRLLGADKQTKKLLEDGRISEGHAKALLGEKNIQKRISIAKKILQDKLSVRDTEREVKKSQNSKQTEEDEEIINLLEEKLCTKVEIKRQKNEKGSINIEFYSYEQLKDIVENIVFDEEN